MGNEAVAAPAAELLSRIRIVLVETSHPGNIGATARAMKTMGLSHLALVRPLQFPSAAATARASGADDILMRATRHETLADAIADCAMVVGTTARARHLEWPVQNPRELAQELLRLAPETGCAIIFGREQSGLSNEELAHCQRAIRIPANDAFSSLNLAQAVQICAYELRMATLATVPPEAVEAEPRATAGEVTDMLAHVLRVMEQSEFYDPARPKLLSTRLRRLAQRGDLYRSEVQIVRGFMSALEEKLAGAT